MDGRVDDRPLAVPPLVGREDVLAVFEAGLGGTSDGTFQFIGLVGEPGAGKTRLLDELAALAGARRLVTLWGRAAEFEQETPFGVLVDALDDHLEGSNLSLAERLGVTQTRLLATVFPALSMGLPDEPDAAADLTGLARYRLYRTVRQLLDELAQPAAGLVLILDDLHWADDNSVELLDHLVRHPPRGRVLIAIAYRPAQASPRLATLVDAAGGHRVTVGPLSEPEVRTLLTRKRTGSGSFPTVHPAKVRALFEASGGNPFYLEALARMGHTGDPENGPVEEGDLPPAVRAALQMELTGLSPSARLVAQAAAVAADEFEPALVAIAAEVSEERALAALDEMAARDVVRPAGGRFRFRHPLVRHAVYGSAAPGWRLAVHARIARHLAGLGRPATLRARHVERSGRFGDQEAIGTLVEAARGVQAQAPATGAHWLKAALRLVPEDDPQRLLLLVELARLQLVSGGLSEGRATAHSVLALLPPSEHMPRARATRFCAMIERLLDRPQESRALLLAELRQIPDPQSAPAVLLRLRLVADSLMRGDYKAAQAVLEMVPERSPGWEPSLEVAVAALRPMPAYASRRFADAIRYAEAAGRVIDAAPDAYLAEWMDAIGFLSWSELFMGRYDGAARRFDRGLRVARSTGQSYIVTTLLSGVARVHAAQGRLREAALAAEEAVEIAQLLRSGQSLALALAQQSMVAGWSGDEEAALRLADQAVGSGGGVGEWAGAQALFARAMALVGAGRLEEAAEVMADVTDDFEPARLESSSAVRCCEAMAAAEAGRGRPAEAAVWAGRTERIADGLLPVDRGRALLARAHALRSGDPAAAAELADRSVADFTEAGHVVDAARARMYAGIAHAEAGDKARARTELGAAAETFDALGTRTLHAHAVREQRRIGVRVPSGGGRGRGDGPHGLSKREQEVATLVAEGFTNQQIAEKLVLSIRTVETHLSHVFTKLGVTSRVGVVTALGRAAADPA